MCICTRTEERCHNHVLMLLAHIQNLGLRIKKEKCRLKPTQASQFFGMCLDVRTAGVTLTRKKASVPNELLLPFLSGTCCHMEAMSPPLGSYGSLSPGGATGHSAHAPCTEVSHEQGTVPTEAPPSQGAGHKEAVRSPQLVALAALCAEPAGLSCACMNRQHSGSSIY